MSFSKVIGSIIQNPGAVAMKSGLEWTAGGVNFGCGQLGGVESLGEAGIGFGWVWIGFVFLIWAMELASIGFELGLFFVGRRGGFWVVTRWEQ